MNRLAPVARSSATAAAVLAPAVAMPAMKSRRVEPVSLPRSGCSRVVVMARQATCSRRAAPVKRAVTGYSGISHSGNQRVMSSSNGSSLSSWAFSRSSCSESRCLSPGAGHERVVGAALEVVDEVDALALVARTGTRRPAGGRRSRRPGARWRCVFSDTTMSSKSGSRRIDPAVAELVVGRLERRARLLGRAVQQLLGVLEDLVEVGGGQRLEHDPRRAGAASCPGRSPSSRRPWSWRTAGRARRP